jgi:hypothetical protein
VSVRYRVVMSDRLWERRDQLIWPDGLGLADDGVRVEVPGQDGWSTVEVEDAHASPALDGRLVDLVLRERHRLGLRPEVVARVPVAELVAAGA